jgi:decaprenyl-phosphate phosphoribosyltransferase
MFKLIGYIVKLIRVKQWPKNLLVAAAPFASGVLPTVNEVNKILYGVLSFCATSSIVYIVNDWKDQKFDRNHKSKKFRPIAAGTVSKKQIKLILIVLFLVSILSLTQLNYKFLIIISIYLVLNLLYSFKLKDIEIIEILIVASGFFLRTLSGAYILEIPISEWFLLVASFGSLYIVSVKRFSEKKFANKPSTRKVISRYSNDFLLVIVGMSLTITLTSYGMWSFGRVSSDTYTGLSMFTLLFALMRYLLSAEKGNDESPEDLIFKDKYIFTSLFLTVCFVSVSLYIES